MNRPAKLIIVMVAVAASAAIGFRTFGPATTEAPPKEKAERKEKAPDNRAEQDEHGADRIYITDVKLAAGGVVLAEAGPATLSDTLQFNGVLRANQEAVVQVTPRFPGIVRSIRKRIGDQVVKDEQLASIESNQSLTVYDLQGAHQPGPSSTGRSRLASTRPSRSPPSSSQTCRPSGSICRSIGRTSSASGSETRC